MSSIKQAVVLIGHGGLPSDCPEKLIQKFMTLHKNRKGGTASKQEAELEQIIRKWPRTPVTDPYQAGLESLASCLKPLLNDSILRTAYNEFCEPSIEDAVKEIVDEGFEDIILTTTMFTPGGSHSDKEIPEEVEKLRQQFPGIAINYAWPFDLKNVARLLATHINSFSKQVTQTIN